MFGMGWQEILVVLAVAVLVIGPEQLPGVARTLGKLMAQFKRATNDLRHAVSEEVAQHQELSDFKEFSADLESEVRNISNTAQEYIETEVEKEEKELEKLEKEVTGGDGGDPGPLSDPLPAEDYGPELAAGEEKEDELREGEAKGEKAAAEEPEEEYDASRKETA